MERKKYIDLHTHTFYSDGIGTPELNVKNASINGLDILAITDHDKTNGYEEALLAGEKWGVQIVAGTEISTDKYHILGLGINIYSPFFRNFMRGSAEEQRKVCIRRIEGLRDKGVPITLEKVLTMFPDSRLGKMNVLYVMLQDKECQDYFRTKEGQNLNKQIYDKYLRDTNGKWVEDKMTAITAKMAIDQIHDAGGIAIIAHPYLDVKDASEMDILLQQGIDGIEIQPRENGRNEPYREFAKRNKLLLTYGSDYHGGLFGRLMLDNQGENILTEELAERLEPRWK